MTPRRPGPRRRGQWPRGDPKDPGPRRVAESLDDVLAVLTPPGAGPGALAPPATAGAWGTVFSRWESIVGPALAHHARPLRIEEGALVVAVDRPPWATQVRALSNEILTRLREESGEALERLVVVVRA